MYATKDKKGYMNGQLSRSGNWFCIFQDPQPRASQNRHRDLACTIYRYNLQPDIWKVILVYIYDLEFERQLSRLRDSC